MAKYVERLLSPFAGKERREPDDRDAEDRARRGGESPFSTIEEAIEEIRARPHGRRLRRRGPRERGRPGDGRPVRHPRGGQLHGQGGARPDLPGADRRALRRARPRPDGGQERGAAADRLHGLDRGRARASPPASPPTTAPTRSRSRSTPTRARATSSSARPRLPAEGQGRRRARAHRPHRGQRRPRPPRRPHPGRRDLRGHERRRHDGPRPRPRPLLRAATA